MYRSLMAERDCGDAGMAVATCGSADMAVATCGLSFDLPIRTKEVEGMGGGYLPGSSPVLGPAEAEGGLVTGMAALMAPREAGDM